MLAWVVIDRRQYRQGGRFAMLLFIPSIPLSHLSPLLPYSYGHSYTTATHQPLCNQSATHSFHRDGGCTPQAHSESRHSPLVTAFKFLPFKFLHTLCQKPPGVGAGDILLTSHPSPRRAQLSTDHSPLISGRFLLSLLECAVPQTRHLKSFRMRSSGKSGGAGV